LNPMTGVIETFRQSFFGQGALSWNMLAYSIGFSIFILIAGVLSFNIAEKNFVDTV